MQITTEARVEIMECVRGCGESVSVTFAPVPVFVPVGEELVQAYAQASRAVHLNGYVQCAKKCNSCGDNGYMKHVTSHKRTFVHTSNGAKECSK